MNETKMNVTAYPSWVKWTSAGVVVGLAFVLSLSFVLLFGVNAPYWDEWELIARLREVYAWRMNWWELFLSKHNEHLIGFAYLVSGLQLFLSGFNSKLQLVSGVLIQALAFGIMVVTLWRSIPEDRRPMWLALSSLVWFSLSQHKNLLWGFQTAWFLVTLLLAITVACLHRARHLLKSHSSADSWVVLAAVSTLLACFTSAQGVIVWLAGIVYLLACNNYQFGDLFRARISRLWILVGMLSSVAFLSIWMLKGGGGAGGGGEFSMRTLAYIFVGVHGSFFGDVGVLGVACLGALVLAFIVLALIKALASQDKAGYALPVALIAFGLVFVLLVAIGRARFGTGAARDPHYTAYSLISIFGALTIFFHRDDVWGARGMIGLGAKFFPWVIAVASFASSYDAVLKGIDWRRSHGLSAATLLNYREAPDFALANQLFGDPALVRKNAEFLESNRLSVFGDAHAVPDAAKPYIEEPQTLRVWQERYPDHKAAIIRAWWVYRIGNDLQRAFDPVAADFAERLMTWVYGASRDGNHYLSVYLKDYAADFAEIHKAEEIRKSLK